MKIKEVERADKYINRFYSKSLGNDFIKAISLKWFRLNTMYFITNKDGKKVRFRPNNHQRDFYINTHGNDIILKVRQLGFTTFKMISDLDDCLFIDNYQSGCIAHNDKAAKEIFRNKVKFAYENIPQSFIQIFNQISSGLPTTNNDRGGQYVFSNGSSISVSTGFRGGTLQSLHVSEFGKICKKRPDVAEEIVTGAFEAVGKDGTKTIESTAEGKEGYFFKYCEEAGLKSSQGDKPLKMEFDLHFYPWFIEPDYAINEEYQINERLDLYFTKLESQLDIKLSTAQRAWYAMKEKVLGDKMKQEYPSTVDEAFNASVEGAYYATQFNSIYKSGRIGKIPDNDVKVHTVWDLGVSDSTSIWFYKKVGSQYHVIDYYENSGEGLEHYFKVLHQKNYDYGRHWAPHDIDVREFGSGAKTRYEMARAGYDIGNGVIYKITFDRVPKLSVNDGIELARTILDKCVFSDNIRKNKIKSGKKEYDGIACLENYRKEWNERLGSYRDNPLHDWASHGADAFRYLAVAELRGDEPIKAWK